MKLRSGSDDLKGSAAGALILLRDYRVSASKDGRYSMVIHIAGKVYSRKALSDYSQVALLFNSYYDSINLDYARVIQKDGTIREVSYDAVQVRNSSESEGLQYTDIKYLSFAFSGLEEGAVFDYQVTYKRYRPIIKGELYEVFMLSGIKRPVTQSELPRIDPVMISRLSITMPKQMEFKYKLSFGSCEPVISKGDLADEYMWELHDLPALTIEGGMPSLSKISPVLAVSTFDRWSDIDSWAYAKFFPKNNSTTAVSEKALELTANVKSDYEKIRIISRFIQKNIRYIYADLDRGGYAPHDPDEVLKSKYGDCKDQSLLLVSMLKAVGIESYPVLLNADDFACFYDFPGLEFSHMITYIPQKPKDIWVDMTSPVTPFPNLFFSDQDKQAFIVDGKGGSLTKTPPQTQFDNSGHFDILSGISGSTGTFRMELSVIGAQSDLLKIMLKGLDIKDQEAFFEKYILTYVSNAIIDSVSLSDVHDPETSFKVVTFYHIDSLFSDDINAFPVKSLAVLGYGILSDIDAAGSTLKRQNDLLRPVLYKLTGTERFIPSNRKYLLLQKPANDSLINEFCTFREKFTSDGSSLKTEWYYEPKTNVIPQAKFQDYITALKSIKSKFDWNALFIEPLPYVAEIMKKSDPNTVINECRSILTRDNQNILIQIIKGLEFSQTNQRDSAMASLKKALKTDPSNIYSNYWMAIFYLSMRNPDQALPYLNTAIKGYPDFTEALLIRGNLYMLKSTFQLASKDFESVLRQHPENTEALLAFGYVKFKTGNPGEAEKTLNRVLEIDSGFVRVYSALGEVYIAENEHKKAISMYQKSIALNAANYNSYGNLGWCYYLAGDDKKCIEYSKKAVSLNPDAYFAEYNIALATLRSGNIKEARHLYELLKLQAYLMTPDVRQGAYKDLEELKAKGKFVNEINEILKQYF